MPWTGMICICLILRESRNFVEITMEYHAAQYVRDMEREERGRCNLY